ncbi:MAG: invasin domain 3-containing protein [Gemmatimonadota bacterium]
MDHSRRNRRWLVTVAFLLLGLACNEDKLTLPAEGEPSVIAVISGNGQADTVGNTLPESLTVRVTDAQGRPVKGQSVSFVLPNSAGEGQILPDTILTDESGRASALWRLGTRAGSQSGQVKVLGISSLLAANLVATAHPSGPDTLTQLLGSNQAGQVGLAFQESLAVRLVDEFGNPIAGKDIAWSAQNGTVSSSAITTGADGRAAVEWTAGMNPGTQHVTATFPGVVGSPSIFTATATLGAPPRLVLLIQPSETAASGVPFVQQPEVQLQDNLGNPILQSGVPVTSTIATGGGTLGGAATVTTNANGIAQFANLFIAGVTGTRTIIFAAAGHTSATSADIDVMASAPSPTQSTVTSSPGTITASNGSSSSTVTVTARDASGNPVSGATIVLAATGSGNHFTQPGLTDGSGVATGTLSSTVSGAKVITATADNIVLNQSPTVTVNAGASDPAGTTATVPASGTSSSVSTITVTVKDAFGNAVTSGGAAVSVLVTGANTATASVSDHGNGIYTAVYTPTLAGSDAIAITLNGSPISGNPFSSTINPGTISGSLSTLAAVPSTIAASTGSSPSAISVTARDAAGNFVSGATVVLAASGTGNSLMQPAVPTSVSGVATGSLSSTIAGGRSVTATINGVAVTQSVTVTVNPGAAVSTSSTAIVPSGKIFQATSIVVTARDQFGNRLTSGGATVLITVTGSNPRAGFTANDNGDGTYSGSYTPIFLGTDTITITLNGVAIVGSPFTSAVGF